MREDGICGKVRRRVTTTTMSDHDDPIAPNVLDRDFTAAGPNQRWVGDTTEFRIGEHGKLYLAAILDLYSRFVVGWAISAVHDRRLTLKALEMAVQRRCPAPGLLHRSDRGCTYTCEDYQTTWRHYGITCSMSRRADCYDCEHDGVAVRPLDPCLRVTSCPGVDLSVWGGQHSPDAVWSGGQ
jgi:putative transposase